MKKVISVLVAFLLFFGCVPKAYGWKAGTHAFIADMLIEEIKTGKITLNGVGAFDVPQEFKDAVLTYPDVFRAGALGPDFYPDIFYGQSYVHPEANRTAGEWMDIMAKKYREMPTDHPERKKSLAFLLGFSLHYAGDTFAHDFVNKWARGSFPNVSDGVTDEETKIILRHMVIEGYIDKLVPSSHKTNVKLDSPKEFILETFIYNKEVPKAPYIQVAGDMRNRLRDAVSQFKAFNGDGNIFDYISYPFTTNYSNYMEYWADDIDKALTEWINTSEKVALAFADDNISKREAIDALETWQSNYLSYVTPVPDVVVDTFKIPGKAVDAIFRALGLEELQEQWSQLKQMVFVAAVEKATGMSIQEIIELEEKVEEKLSDEFLFEENAKEHLSQFLGNFGQSEDPLNQEFNAFNNTIVLSKLCLLGADNLNSLVNKMTGGNGDFNTQAIIGSYNNFDVEVHTKSNGWFEYNGTDDDIFFGIKMKNGAFYERIMDKKNYNDFEGGDKDTYKIELPERIKLEDIAYVQLRKRSIINDDWTPTYMKMSYKGNAIKSWNINNEFVGNESQQFSINGYSERPTGRTQFDPSIINFTRSLDESDQIKYFKFFNNPTYKEKIYDVLFMPEEDVY